MIVHSNSFSNEEYVCYSMNILLTTEPLNTTKNCRLEMALGGLPSLLSGFVCVVEIYVRSCLTNPRRRIKPQLTNHKSSIVSNANLLWVQYLDFLLSWPAFFIPCCCYRCRCVSLLSWIRSGEEQEDKDRQSAAAVMSGVATSKQTNLDRLWILDSCRPTY